MIENRTTSNQQKALQFLGEISSIKTKKVMFGTQVLYGVMIATSDPRALTLGALKATQEVKITVEPTHEPEKANKEREFK